MSVSGTTATVPRPPWCLSGALCTACTFSGMWLKVYVSTPWWGNQIFISREGPEQLRKTGFCPRGGQVLSGTQGLWPAGSSPRSEAWDRGRRMVFPPPHIFFPLFCSRSLSPVTWNRLQQPATQAPGHTATRAPSPTACLTSGSKEVNCSNFWFTGHVLGISGGQSSVQPCVVRLLWSAFTGRGRRGSQTGPHLLLTGLLTYHGRRSVLDGFLGPSNLTPCFAEGEHRPKEAHRLAQGHVVRGPVETFLPWWETQQSTRSGHRAQGQPFLSRFCLGATGTRGSVQGLITQDSCPGGKGRSRPCQVSRPWPAAGHPIQFAYLPPFLPPSFLCSSIIGRVSVFSNKCRDVKGSEWAG